MRDILALLHASAAALHLPAMGEKTGMVDTGTRSSIVLRSLNFFCFFSCQVVSAF